MIWWPGRELNPRRQPFQAVFFEPKPFFNQQLNSSRWPLYCDHSVTSADVRLSVGAQNIQESMKEEANKRCPANRRSRLYPHLAVAKARLRTFRLARLLVDRRFSRTLTSSMPARVKESHSSLSRC